MAEFKSFDSGVTVDKRYTLKTIVYLESREDLSILSNIWFFDFGEHIEFRSSVDDTHSTGGYSGVRSRVDKDLANGIKALGIVDRDALFSKRKWDILFEIDDQKYKSAIPFGENIHALLRWEIENYLFDPLAVEEYLADHERGRERREIETVIEELNEQCSSLLFIMAACILLHQNGKTLPAPGFCCNLLPKDIKQKVTSKLIHPNLDGSAERKSFFDNTLKQLAKFDEMPGDNASRLESLLRIIDGKRLLERLKYKYKIKDDPRFHLATKIKKAERVPTEISNFLSALY